MVPPDTARVTCCGYAKCHHDNSGVGKGDWGGVGSGDTGAVGVGSGEHVGHGAQLGVADADQGPHVGVGRRVRVAVAVAVGEFVIVGVGVAVGVAVAVGVWVGHGEPIGSRAEIVGRGAVIAPRVPTPTVAVLVGDTHIGVRDQVAVTAGHVGVALAVGELVVVGERVGAGISVALATHGTLVPVASGGRIHATSVPRDGRPQLQRVIRTALIMPHNANQAPNPNTMRASTAILYLRARQAFMTISPFPRPLNSPGAVCWQLIFRD